MDRVLERQDAWIAVARLTPPVVELPPIVVSDPPPVVRPVNLLPDGRLLRPSFRPTEAGLWDDVSFNKGCYTGQDIIARMESRGQLAKQLVRLTSNNAINEGEEISVVGKRVGSITSAASTAEGTIALGYVKSAALEDNNPLFAGDSPLELVQDLR